MLKNKKGFNLFTALISLMLLSITLVFIFNMVQTEENYLELINNQSQASDLLTIADISRADAFNNFVVSFREQWMSFRSDSDSEIRLTRKDIMLDWDNFVDYFADYIFFDNNFEDHFARNMVESLNYTNPPTGYDIDVPTYSPYELSRIIKKAFLAAGDDKIKVVSCERKDEVCLGTLYFTIDTRKLSAEEYETLPMITVKRNVDDEVIQRPVFAKRAYRIYIPWRGFQALRTVRNFALDADLEKRETTSEIIENSKDSRGFFNPYIHYTLNSAKLGVCDIDSCALRKDLFKTVELNGFTGATCSNPPEVSNVSDNGGISVPFAGRVSLSNTTHSYKIQDIDGTVKPIYNDLVKTTIKNNLENRSDTIHAGKKLPSIYSSSSILDDECQMPLTINGFSICNIRVRLPSPKVTKEVTSVGAVSESLSNLFPVSFNPSGFNKASNLSLSIDDYYNINVFDQESIPNQTNYQYLSCTTIDYIDLLFKFEEQDEKYIFSEDSKNIYIQISDRFSDYTFFTSSESVPTFNGGYFQKKDLPLFTGGNGWTCKSYEENEDDAACIAG
ncbi:MAG: hypothetical protein PHX47_02200 [Candidatus ainarchaeum sp.]|nr:hypothetical protein [Candidatus ainarchaeum sp.]